MCKETKELFSELSKAKTKEDMKRFLKQNNDQLKPPSVAEYLTELLETHNFKKSEIIVSTGLDRRYAYNLLNGTKSFTRDKLLMFAIAAKLTIEETNGLLKYARESKLYARDRRDAIIIFALNSNLNIYETNDLLAGNTLKEFEFMKK